MNESDALAGFIALFDAERYWESHEVLEAVWRENGSGFLKGLILFASAFVHVQRGNAHGILAQFDKAERELAPYAPEHLGIDVARLLAHAADCRAIVAAHANAAPEVLARLVPHLKLGD